MNISFAMVLIGLVLGIAVGNKATAFREMKTIEQKTEKGFGIFFLASGYFIFWVLCIKAGCVESEKLFNVPLISLSASFLVAIYGGKRIHEINVAIEEARNSG